MIPLQSLSGHQPIDLTEDLFEDAYVTKQAVPSLKMYVGDVE